jgi:hypothetical protein
VQWGTDDRGELIASGGPRSPTSVGLKPDSSRETQRFDIGPQLIADVLQFELDSFGSALTSASNESTEKQKIEMLPGAAVDRDEAGATPHCFNDRLPQLAHVPAICDLWWGNGDLKRWGDGVKGGSHLRGFS